MDTKQLALIATAVSFAATLGLSYLGVPARVNCTIGYLFHTSTFVLADTR